MHAEQKVESVPADRPIFGLPVDTRILFANHKGVYKPRLEKSKTKLLKKIVFLGKFLDADEKIVLVTTGCSPFTMFEQLTVGVGLVVLLKRALFVFTNNRLLHIPTTWSFRYRGSIAQVLYQDCQRLHVKGSRLIAEYHSGRKEKFLYLPRRDRKVIKRCHFSTSESDRRSENPQRNHLCPNCTEVLRSDTVTCPTCSLEFKSKAKARRYSVLIPGGGYFYTRHPFMGICDAMAESYLLVLTVLALGFGLLGDAKAMAVFPMFLAALTVEKLVTIYHANSFLAEFIPEDLKTLLRGQSVPVAPTPAPTQTPARPEPKGRPEDVLSVR
jgi:hypothetical protein